jgi:primary-amine oxidase
MPHHPLDPLSADEIRHVATILRRDQGVTARWRIASIELREPSKASVGAHRPGTPVTREARVVCWNRDDGQAYRGLVSLGDDRVSSWRHESDAQPNMTVDEYHECNEAMRREPRVIQALARRGVSDMQLVFIEVWAYGGHLVPERYANRRLGWTDVWYRTQEGSNLYANHVSGLRCVVDLNRMELLELEDDGIIDEPLTMGEYAPRFVPGQRLRSDVRPLEIVQPEGASFRLDGNLLQWQKWSLRIGFNHREGLVLHTVG